jgi:hypothetical protein
LRHCSCRECQKGEGRNEGQNKGTYGAIPNTSFDQLHGRRIHYSRLVCVFVQRLGTDEDETQLGKPNTVKLRKRKDSRQRKGMDTTNGAGTVDHAVALDSL